MELMVDEVTGFAALPGIARIGIIVGVAVLAHVLVRALRRLGEWIMTPRASGPRMGQSRLGTPSPRVVTVAGLGVSALAFVIYFAAVGLIVQEIGVPLAAYLASASVVGLAIGFGSQGLVQDVVIGLTLIFSDTFDIGDTIEISGQVGRVQRLGLRFTQLINIHGQRVYIPNRTIGLVARYRRGQIRAYADIEIPSGMDEQEVTQVVEGIARGMRAQHRAIIVGDPEILGVSEAEPGGWRYLRVKFRLWPGQGGLIENAFRQRVLAALREVEPAYPDWKVVVTYRVA